MFFVQSSEFFVAERTLAGSIISQDRNGTIDESVSFDVAVIDAITKVKVENIGWKVGTFFSSRP